MSAGRAAAAAPAKAPSVSGRRAESSFSGWDANLHLPLLPELPREAVGGHDRKSFASQLALQGGVEMEWGVGGLGSLMGS